ncbi:cysteine desulfurase family protein [Armatimonas sp.]|uniref:cysteine desulfurase family protein n=1 Tax=Armatimonas sp. TaxID=1872638 RepID=UPI0037526CD1
MSQAALYLDYAATTPTDPQVRDAMLPFLGESFGNPSSVHRMGQTVRRALDAARDTLAAAIGAESGEIYFTSGGTEANNLALLGVLMATKEQGRNHLITSPAEHHAVLDTALFARELGFEVTLVPVDEYGMTHPELIAEALTDKTALVSVMHANNEVGTINPIVEIAALAHAHGALFHTDAVQTLGALPIDVTALGVDLMSVSSHKIYGPKGVGALYIKSGVKCAPLFHGGSQERQKRPGTENVPGIVGFGKAVSLLPEWRDEVAARLLPLRDSFIARFPLASLNGHPTQRLASNTNLSFTKPDGETMLLALDLWGICASSGSACSSGSIDPSHVLSAMGVPRERALGAVRFSLGRYTSAEELEKAAGIIERLVASQF